MRPRRPERQPLSTTRRVHSPCGLDCCGCLVRVRGPSALLRELRAAPRRTRAAHGPSPPPPRLPPIDHKMWLQFKHPLQDSPYRRRDRQWRVVFKKQIVARNRPSTKACVVDVFEPGALIWSCGEPRADGWLELSDPYNLAYALIDATPMGLGVLLEPVEPPILDEGACKVCKAAPCCCEVLAAYGR